jgi:hypothetical protein
LSARLDLRPRVLLFIIRAQSRPLTLRRIEPQFKSHTFVGAIAKNKIK